MRSFGFGIPPALPWSFILLLLLSVARLASCAPVALAGIDAVGLDQRHLHVLSDLNAPKTPLLVPIPTQMTSTPAAGAPVASDRRPYTYAPPPPTAVIDTSEPTRPFSFNFPGYITKSTQDADDAHSGSIVSTFSRNDDDRKAPASGLKGGVPFKFNYLSRIPPPRSIVFPSSLLSPALLDVNVNIIQPTTDGRPVVEHQPAEESESSQLPLLGNWKTNVGTDALADRSPRKGFGMVMIPTILEKLKCLVRHGGSGKSKGVYIFLDAFVFLLSTMS